MAGSTSRKRPWLAALLSALATGLGHLYLRRWRRALGWLTVSVGVSILFTDLSAFDSLANWSAVDLLAIAPLLVVGGLCVFDAYVIAHVQNAVVRLSVSADGELTHCPNCGKELDSDLEFCHWCTTQVGHIEESLPEDLTDHNEL